MKLPELKASELVKILYGLEFVLKRQMFFAHKDSRTTVIPNHSTEFIDRGLLNKIIKHDIKITRKEFMKLAK